LSICRKRRPGSYHGHMPFDPDAPDDAFLAEFEGGEIPPTCWNHRCHVRMAWLYLCRLPLDQTVEKVRAGLLRLNATHKVPDELERGYHETVTQAWMRIVQAAMRHHGACEDSRAFCAAQPHLMCNALLRLYYTRGRIITAEAKKAFVEPDIAPLPA